MANGNRGMGRGLAAILSPTIPAEGSEPTPELRRLPVIHHDPHCAGSEAYFELAKEVAARG